MTVINELDFKLYVMVVDTEDGRFEYEYGNLSHARERLQNEDKGFIMGYKDGMYYSIDQKLKEDTYSYEDKTLMLTQDASDKIQISINADNLYYELRKFFNWRKDKGNIDKNIKRFKALGSHSHDRLIEYLSNAGY